MRQTASFRSLQYGTENSNRLRSKSTSLTTGQDKTGSAMSEAFSSDSDNTPTINSSGSFMLTENRFCDDTVQSCGTNYSRDTENQHGGTDTLLPLNQNVEYPERERRKRRRLQTASQRRAANMRERRRMCHLNEAFKVLKNHLPNIRERSRMSRIQTLKAAISYIQYLARENQGRHQS